MYGKKIRRQPNNLMHVIRMEGCKYDALRPYFDWCDSTYGVTQYINYSFVFHWSFAVGMKYSYMFFKSKNDAMQFKLVWG